MNETKLQHARELARDMKQFTWNSGDDTNELINLMNECSGIEPTSPGRASRGASTVASRMRFSQPDQTLIFMDFDDTLFPTAELFDTWKLPSQRSSWADLQLSSAQQRELENWQEALCNMMSVAFNLSSRVVVLTNSKRPWVEECIERFAPKLQSLLERHSEDFRVVYALEELCRSNKKAGRPVINDNWGCDYTEEEIAERLTAAKFAAMRNETKDFYAQYPGQSWKNILSYGDAKYEHDALQELAFTRDSPARELLRTKIITVPEKPPIRQLAWGLTVRGLLLPAFVHFEGNVDINLNHANQFERLRIMAEALQMRDLENMTLGRQVSPDEDVPLITDLPADGSDASEIIDAIPVLVQSTVMD